MSRDTVLGFIGLCLWIAMLLALATILRAPPLPA